MPPPKRAGTPLVVAAAALDGGFALFLIAVQAFFPSVLDAGAGAPGYALGIYGTTRLLLQAPGGVLARRIGTGRQIALGMGGGALALLALSLAGSAPMAYLLTFIYGLLTALVWPPILLRAGDLFAENRGELIGYVSLSSAVATVGGLAAGSFLIDYIPIRQVVGLAALWLALGAVLAAAMLAGQRTRLAPRQHTAERADWPGGAASLFAALLCQGLGLAVLTPIMRQYAIEQLHLRLHDLIVLGLPAAACAALTFLAAGRLTDRLGRAPVVAGGAAIAALGTLLVSQASGGRYFVLAAIPLGVGYAASAPALSAWVTDLGDRGGGTLGAALTVQGLALAVGPLLGGLIVSVSRPAVTMQVSALFWLLAAVFALLPPLALSREPRTTEQPSSERCS
ncbi:MAG TPA: MFS transporter [Thermomicrobiaceae bacterium]|nr:MFS transporter [Thermomicrobiaceae bacterium]